MTISKSVLIATAIGMTVGAGTMWVLGRHHPEPVPRQTEVRKAGAQVMPFDLDRTTHTFTKIPGGGVEEVRAKDAGDKSQIDLARGHLREEADKFSRGDFSDPAKIHGDNMPGLAMLKENAARMQFTYEDLPDGGKITYAAPDETTIDALYQWFDAQLSDHGSDAMPGHYRPSH